MIRFRGGPLAVLNILIVALMLAVGLRGILADGLRLPSTVTIRALQMGQPVDKAAAQKAAVRLARAAHLSKAARADLALAMLADASDPADVDYRVAGDHAARQLRTYLASAPDDGLAWANLALAERRRGTGGAAVMPFKMSIELAPASATALVWRCGFGLDLYSALDDDGKAMLARQFNLAMEDGLDSSISEQVVRAAQGRLAEPLIEKFLADNSEAGRKFESLARRKP
jgi:hypothetical protein